MKILMFPGQGAQSKGMGKEVFDRYPELVRTWDGIVEDSLTQLCLDVTDHRLHETRFTQPTLFAVSAMLFLDRHQATVDARTIFIGHSLGLYGALFAAGVLDFETAVRIVKRRGELMGRVQNGGMMAVLGPNADAVDQILRDHDIYDLDVANYNSDVQIVLSGLQEALARARAILDSRGFRCVPLPVSGAFHSRQMNGVRAEFFRFLAEQNFRPFRNPVVSTSNGTILLDSFLPEDLSFQLVKPVRWAPTIKCLRAAYPDAEFTEVGPGQTLGNLNRAVGARESLTS